MSPYSPKSLLSLSSLNSSKSSILPTYTFRVAPECTASASEGGSGPEFFPQPILRRRLLRVRPWYDDTWKNVKAAAGSTNVTNCIYAWSYRQKSLAVEEESRINTHRNMLVLHVPHTLQYTSPDSVTQILCRRLWVDVPQIHCSIKSLHSCASS